ncbi:lanthionine synthetase LanC family protein [Dyadobacter beijingensis]|uniref:lanthionine synthetase LanC family protein n=1 Tax=Dyadobacter beijingensis TaxID=365489 RepID=UPI00146D779B|nr:lanthionine synthetase LanC family protein [Dyadobacter beijingensis]
MDPIAKTEAYSSTELIHLVDHKIGLNATKGDGLYAGELGIVLFYLHAFLLEGDVKFKNKALKKLNEVIERIGTPSGLTGSISLSAGFTGLGWVLFLLKKYELIGAEYDDFKTELDERIYKRALLEIGHHNFDYMHGALGALTYLCEGDVANQTVREHITALAQGLLSSRPAGIDYIKNEYIYRKLKFTVEDDLNFGLVHGLPGILLGLLGVYEKGLLQNEIRDAVERGVGYMLSLAKFENEEDLDKSIFPTNQMLSLPAEDPQNVGFYTYRMGWCYGDLNQVMLLYRAGSVLGNPGWISIAGRLGSRCLKRKTQTETWVDNPHLCHGSSSLALIFQHLKQFDHEMYAGYEGGVAFWENETEKYQDKILHDDAATDVSFLSGLSGIALARFALEDPQYNEWQKIMLLY